MTWMNYYEVVRLFPFAFGSDNRKWFHGHLETNLPMLSALNDVAVNFIIECHYFDRGLFKVGRLHDNSYVAHVVGSTFLRYIAFRNEEMALWYKMTYL